MVDQDKYPKDKEEPMTDMQAPFAKVPWIVRGILAFIVAGISIALAATVSTFFLILLVIALMIVATEEGSGLDR